MLWGSASRHSLLDTVKKVSEFFDVLQGNLAGDLARFLARGVSKGFFFCEGGEISIIGGRARTGRNHLFYVFCAGPPY